ncbi:hypothetical protein MUCCIDRAFT_106785 [Mucor lusitanicus CBS 277.49]|uniref:Glutamine amidotransferase type-2 domain-containing protein n=2 Tax=Mucor circinelloides f. lusitanicus TaxID=29924 RepID=A0A162ZC62_MUCCL|nr:hypothetical protein MUCCIDRAFT_106785 [Mucor lusitanicus CBS 277.49]
MAKSLELIKHRGPDGEGTYFSPCGRCALGHVRLSIVGLDDGQQPLSNHDQSVHAVVNGELYGYKDIKMELEAKGYAFKTATDSEVVLYLYEEYGISFLDHLRGEYAICIWDSKRKRIFLARDRFGIKPLYYTQIKGTLFAASEIKAFLPFGWEPEWDVDSILQGGVHFDTRTAFKGVRSLNPGHYLMATPTGTVHIQEYWSASYPSKTAKETRSVDEMVQGVRDRLVDAIEQRLIADVPVGVYLSGGIDSSCIAGIVDHLKKKSNIQTKTKAFALAFIDDDDFNEGNIAKRTAAFCDANFQVLQVTEGDLLDNFESSVWHVEQFHFNLNSVGKFMLSKMVRDQGYKVVLTGEGSDEHFGGYIHFQADYLLEPDLSAPDGIELLSDEQREKKLNMFSSQQDFKKYSKTDFTDDGDDTHRKMLNNISLPPLWGSSFSLSSQYYSKMAVEQYGSPNPALAIAESMKGVDRTRAATDWHPLHTSLDTALHSFFPNYMLCPLGDRVEMAHSIEARTPFLDHLLCEYINGLPPSVKIKPNKEGPLIEKWILREAVKPYVTQEIYERTKAPFFAPPTKKPTAKFMGLLDKFLTRKNIDRLGWIRYDKVSEAMTTYLKTNDLRTYQDLLIITSYVILFIRFHVAPYQPSRFVD